MNLVLIKLNSRNTQAVQVQEILTQNGCHIAVRLGLHEIAEQNCSNDGLIILQVTSDEAAIQDMVNQLEQLEGVDVKTVTM